MGGDDYLGSIDWDRIYQEFHNPLDIAKRIERELGGSDAAVLFAGFSDVAEHLAKTRNVSFIDYSATIIEKSKQKKGSISNYIVGDVCHCLSEYSTIIIACRVSAFWKSTEQFIGLLQAIDKHPRKTVLIDFFDINMVEENVDIHFVKNDHTGCWKITSIKDTHDTPQRHHCAMDISYTLDNAEITYPATRAFFQRSSIEKLFRESLSDYWVEIKNGFMESDPSFFVKLTPKDDDLNTVA